MSSDEQGARIDTAAPVSDEVKTTTGYMCACRRGIKVHLVGGQIRYIEGNRDHPVNKGGLCARGSARIMHQASPAKPRKPLKRVGPRGVGPYQETEWDEALDLAVRWLAPIRKDRPGKPAAALDTPAGEADHGQTGGGRDASGDAGLPGFVDRLYSR